MWTIVVFLATLFLPYTRLIITLENKNFFDAMKASANMAINHFGITFKFIIINFFLFARFIVNIIILIGIPVLILYLVYRLGIESDAIQTILVIILIGLFLLTAYINGIIEAFFNTYRYKLYQHLMKEEREESAEHDRIQEGQQVLISEENE